MEVIEISKHWNSETLNYSVTYNMIDGSIVQTLPNWCNSEKKHFRLCSFSGTGFIIKYFNSKNIISNSSENYFETANLWSKYYNLSFLSSNAKFLSISSAFDCRKLKTSLLLLAEVCWSVTKATLFSKNMDLLGFFTFSERSSGICLSSRGCLCLIFSFSEFFCVD